MGRGVAPLLVTLVLTVVVASISYYNVFVKEEQNFCSMTYMDRRFIHVPLQNVSRLENKYSLYLYREGFVHHFTSRLSLVQQASGVPVIFVPGNAGHYDQVAFPVIP